MPHRFPENTVSTLDDFRHSPWKAILAPAADGGYAEMWRALSGGAQASFEAGRFPEAKVLWLLADACSMILRPRSTSEPFGASSQFGNNRSALPDDFSEDDIALLAQIADEADNDLLRGRVADLVWLLKTPRSPRHALLAVDAYRSMPLEATTWAHGAREMWDRALNLAQSLGTGSGNRVDDMVSAVVSAFDRAGPSDRFLALGLADLLFDHGLAGAQASHIAGQLQALAVAFEGDADLRAARDYYNAAANWFQRASDSPAAATMIVCLAECWVKEGTARASSEARSFVVAAHFYETAIQTYRRIPRSERGKHGVDERLVAIHGMLNDAGDRSLAEMQAMQSPVIDIGEIVDAARNAVDNKSIKDALAAFVGLYAGAKESNLRDAAEKLLSQSVLRRLFDSTRMSSDGRVIAKTPGGLPSRASNDYQAQLWAEMIRHYVLETGLVTNGSIVPALQLLLTQHRLRESDFVEIARHAPIVPRGRESLMGKALFAGFDLEFETAIHLLIPQIEDLVRTHLKSAGAKTTNIDHDGIENECGLSTLMDLPEANKVFGENLTFEIKSLFCDPLGPNLRNQLAHGLLDDITSRSVPCIYAWWFALKLVYMSFWSATCAESNAQTPAPSTATSAPSG